MRLGLKKLDILILKSFLGPFIITFLLVLFTLDMQFFWLYMDELIGKGLGVGLMLQLLLYMAATLVPLALPLGIMLASIMTFGNLGEHYELVAIKSSGISLGRILRPMAIFIVILSAGAFLFNNYVIPNANLKSYSLLYDMRNQKPTSSINEGIFNKDFNNFLIRVGKKHKDGQTIEDIVIYDHSNSRGNNNMILATSGKMYPSSDNKYLVFELYNGWRYEEKSVQNRSDFTRMHFDVWYKTFNLADFAFKRTQEDQFNNNQEMMNVFQLADQIDTMRNKQKSNFKSIGNSIHPYLSLFNGKLDSAAFKTPLSSQKTPLTYKDYFYTIIPDSAKYNVLENALASMRNIERTIGIMINENDYQETRIAKFNVEWHKKFSLSIACIVLFFIGAPLGSIIRKGGLGIPVLVSIIFFLIYFVTSTWSEKLAEQRILPVWLGVWMSTLVLTPIAAYILYKSRQDAFTFNNAIWSRLADFFKKLFTKKEKTQPVQQQSHD